MYVRFDEISNLENGGLYVLARFWQNKNQSEGPHLVENDFLFPNLQANGVRVITNQDGWPKLANGTFQNPNDFQQDRVYEFQTEPYEIDIKEVIMETCSRYFDRWKNSQETEKPYRKKHAFEFMVKRKNEDPRGLKKDIQVLVGQGIEHD